MEPFKPLKWLGCIKSCINDKKQKKRTLCLSMVSLFWQLPKRSVMSTSHEYPIHLDRVNWKTGELMMENGISCLDHTKSIDPPCIDSYRVTWIDRISWKGHLHFVDGIGWKDRVRWIDLNAEQLSCWDDKRKRCQDRDKPYRRGKDRPILYRDGILTIRFVHDLPAKEPELRKFFFVTCILPIQDRYRDGLGVVAEIKSRNLNEVSICVSK